MFWRTPASYIYPMSLLVSHLFFASNAHAGFFFFPSTCEFLASFLAFTELWHAVTLAIFTLSSRVANCLLSSSLFNIPLFHSLVYVLFKAWIVSFLIFNRGFKPVFDSRILSSFHWVLLEDCSLWDSSSFFSLPFLGFVLFFFSFESWS